MFLGKTRRVFFEKSSVIPTPAQYSCYGDIAKIAMQFFNAPYASESAQIGGSPVKFCRIESAKFYIVNTHLRIVIQYKKRMWISTAPALGDYIPVAPTNDEAKQHNSKLPGMGGVFNHINLNCYHYAGNNPVRYVDPDGRYDSFILNQQPEEQNSFKNFGTALGCYVLGSLIVCGTLVEDAATGGVGTVDDAASFAFAGSLFAYGNHLANGGNQKTPSPIPKKGAVSAAPGSPAPNGNNNKSSRNKPKENGTPNSTEVERNSDGSVKRITQYDRNGNFQKEIRPNTKGQHGINGPTTKEPHYNTTPDGRIFRNGNIVRPATPEEINLLNSF